MLLSYFRLRISNDAFLIMGCLAQLGLRMVDQDGRMS